MYELIIIGAGPAGITASVYAARKKMDFLVISPDIGGQAALSGDVENYTGYQFISGPELTKKFEEHMRQFGVKLNNEKAIKIEKKDTRFVVRTDTASYDTKTVLIASGKRPRYLNARGEKEFKNKGLSYCAVCDGPLFSGKDLAIIGGGNSALDTAIQLIKIANKVHIVNINPQIGGDKIMRDIVKGSSKVTIINGARTAEILGNKFVTGLKFIKDNQEKKIDVQGVFVEIGSIPNTEFIDFVQKNQRGEIKIDRNNMTSVPGIFAAGDVTEIAEKQIIIAAGEGSKALLSLSRYLTEQIVRSP